MEAGLAHTVRDCEWIVGLMDAAAPKAKTLQASNGTGVGTKVCYTFALLDWVGGLDPSRNAGPITFGQSLHSEVEPFPSPRTLPWREAWNGLQGRS